MKAVVIYTQPNCKKSDQAKKILLSTQMNFIEKDTSEVAIKREMIERTGGRALTPQIFINGMHVGSFDEFSSLYKKNKKNN